MHFYEVFTHDLNNPVQMLCSNGIASHDVQMSEKIDERCPDAVRVRVQRNGMGQNAPNGS